MATLVHPANIPQYQLAVRSIRDFWQSSPSEQTMFSELIRVCIDQSYFETSIASYYNNDTELNSLLKQKTALEAGPQGQCTAALLTLVSSMIANRKIVLSNAVIDTIIQAWRNHLVFVNSYMWFSNAGRAGVDVEDNCAYYSIAQWNDATYQQNDCSTRWRNNRNDYDLFTSANQSNAVASFNPVDKKCGGRADYARLRCVYRTEVRDQINGIITMYENKKESPSQPPSVNLNCLQCTQNMTNVQSANQVEQVMNCAFNGEIQTNEATNEAINEGTTGQDGGGGGEAVFFVILLAFIAIFFFSTK